MKDKIYLKYKGRDSWDRPVYQDESGKLWKDVEPYSDRPAHLCSACDNAFDGEPDNPMNAMARYQNITVIYYPTRDVWR